MKDWPELSQELAQLKRQGRFRQLKNIEKKEGPYVYVGGRRLLNLSSNDYLGLTTRLRLEEILAELASAPTGAGAARLLSGNHCWYEQVEGLLTALFKRPALVFSSGYTANLGIISALCGRKDVIFADKLVHASIIDGARLSGAAFFRYPHLNYEALEELLKKHRFRYRRALIISESVFSMDGDKAQLAPLCELKERYEAFFLLDEAHALGVFGEKGLGLSEEEGRLEEVDLLLGTFGKALGSYGAFVVTSQTLKDYLINKARPFIFTTALPPLVLAVTKKALTLLPELKREREKLRHLSRFLRAKLGLAPDDTPIVPVVVGSEEQALTLARRLEELGYFAPAIRPPTVPPGTARLRISLTAAMEEEMLAPLVAEIRRFLAENS